MNYCALKNIYAIPDTNTHLQYTLNYYRW